MSVSGANNPISASVRRDLPVRAVEGPLRDALSGHDSVVIVGETGCGKTTQVPQILVDRCGCRRVLVTQPRRVAATSVAQRVAQERRCRLGAEVGYAIRFDDCTSGDATRITYATDGVALRKCLSSQGLGAYDCVVLDEAHERSVQTDVLFGLLKRALARRPQPRLRLVIMSATLDADRFAGYLGGCPVLKVPGRTFPVDVYHSKTAQSMTAKGPATSAYIDASVKLVLKLHRTQSAGHVLVFLTGQDEIEKAKAAIEEAVASGDPAAAPSDGAVRGLAVVPLYGALSSQAQHAAFDECAPGVRKVVLATNIAETSLTVPGVKFVVDPGFVKQKTYDPERGMEALVVVPCSQTAAQQRAGRAGRTGPGQCYRLYSTRTFDTMAHETVPEIKRVHVGAVVLSLKSLAIADVVAFDFFDPPDADQMVDALHELHALGALDDRGALTRSPGAAMARLPLDPRLARTLVAAWDLCGGAASAPVVEDAVSAVATLSAESVWHARPSRNGERDEAAFAAHARFKDARGDHVTYVRVWRAWQRAKFSVDWLKDNHLSVRAMRTVRKVRAQLLDELGKLDDGAPGAATATAAPADHGAALASAFCCGFLRNAAARCGASAMAVYRGLPRPGGASHVARGGGGSPLLHVHSQSALADDSLLAPPCVVYVELMVTARPYIKHVVAVDEAELLRRRAAVGRVSHRELCGHPKEVAAAPVVVRAAKRAAVGDGAEDAAPPAAATAGGKSKAALARERFLERKRMKS